MHIRQHNVPKLNTSNEVEGDGCWALLGRALVLASVFFTGWLIYSIL